MTFTKSASCFGAAALLLILIALSSCCTTAAVTASGISGTIKQCGGNSCSGSNCVTIPFNSSACTSLADGTAISATCGSASACVTGTFYSSMDCSGPGTPYSALGDGTCGTLGGSWLYWSIAPDGSGVKVALACGDMCANCVAVSPVRSWGSCVPGPWGSVRVAKQAKCQQATLNVYPNSCSDVPRVVDNQGAGTCSASDIITYTPTAFSITCAGVAPPPATPAPTVPGQTTPAPTVPGQTTNAPTTTLAPMVTRTTCRNTTCKTDCRGYTYPASKCMQDWSNNASFMSQCPTPGGAYYIVQNHWNASLHCEGKPSFQDYDIPGNCMVAYPNVNSSYTVTCRAA